MIFRALDKASDNVLHVKFNGAIFTENETLV